MEQIAAKGPFRSQLSEDCDAWANVIEIVRSISTGGPRGTISGVAGLTLTGAPFELIVLLDAFGETVRIVPWSAKLTRNDFGCRANSIEFLFSFAGVQLTPCDQFGQVAKRDSQFRFAMRDLRIRSLQSQGWAMATRRRFVAACDRMRRWVGAKMDLRVDFAKRGVVGDEVGALSSVFEPFGISASSNRCCTRCSASSHRSGETSHTVDSRRIRLTSVLMPGCDRGRDRANLFNIRVCPSWRRFLNSLRISGDGPIPWGYR